MAALHKYARGVQQFGKSGFSAALTVGRFLQKLKTIQDYNGMCRA